MLEISYAFKVLASFIFMLTWTKLRLSGLQVTLKETSIESKNNSEIIRRVC